MYSNIKIVKLSEHAQIPTRGSIGAAGYDIYSAYDDVVPGKSRKLIKTDIALGLPFGTYGRIAPRSGLAVKNFIGVGAGVIDCDYAGPVGVLLFNHSSEDYHIERGDRVAQLIVEKIAILEFEEVDHLVYSKRGTGGFGSTGK